MIALAAAFGLWQSGAGCIAGRSVPTFSMSIPDAAAATPKLIRRLFQAEPTLPPLVGETLAPFTVRKSNGEPLNWRPGRLTLICFCALWCDTWKTQLPRLQLAEKDLTGLPCDYLAISVDGRWLDKARGSTVANLLSDPGGAWSAGVGIDRVPYTLIVDAKGTIRWTEHGILRSDEVVRQMHAAMRALTGGTIYLTFDDFPGRGLNDELLDLLRAKKVPATFFCEGSRVASSTVLLQRVVREGHEAQVHSWDHDAQHPRIPDCVQAIASATGTTPTLFRPPGSEQIERIEGETIHIFVDDPYDYTRPSVPELARRILNNIRPETVIQLHAGVPETIKVLPKVIDNLRSRNYTFKLLAAR